jgi:hypothetical protein
LSFPGAQITHEDENLAMSLPRTWKANVARGRFPRSDRIKSMRRWFSQDNFLQITSGSVPPRKFTEAAKTKKPTVNALAKATCGWAVHDSNDVLWKS